MIDSWDYTQDLQTEMKNWVEIQMDESKTPVTFHREFFRRKMDGQAFFQKWWKFYGPKFPCDQHSRWRDYLFDRNDWGKTFSLGGGGGGKLMISELVDNKYIPRGLVSEFKWEYNDQPFQSGFFTFCKIC